MYISRDFELTIMLDLN